MVDEIQDRRSRELVPTCGRPEKAAEADLKQLRDKQAANLKKTQAGPGPTPTPEAGRRAASKLAKEQQQIQDDLKKQMAKSSPSSTNEVGPEGRARQAVRARWPRPRSGIDQDQGEQAEEGEKKKPSRTSSEAQEEVVAAARKEAEEQLAMEQIAKMDRCHQVGRRATGQDGRRDRSVTRRPGPTTTASSPGPEESASRIWPRPGGFEGRSDRVDRQASAKVRRSSASPSRKAAESMENAAQRTAVPQDRRARPSRRRNWPRLVSSKLVDSLKPDKARNGGGQQPPEQGRRPGRRRRISQGGRRHPRGGPDQGPQVAPARVERQDRLLRRAIASPERAQPGADRRTRKAPRGAGHDLADLVRDLTRPKKDDGEQ